MLSPNQCSFNWRTHARSAALVASLLLAAAGHAAAIANTSGSILYGEWEVTRVLMTGGMQPQWSMREDDPRLMARTLRIDTIGVEFRHVVSSCVAQPMVGAQKLSMKTLFAKESGVKRPIAMKGRAYGRVANYDLGSLRNQSVALLQLRCKDPEKTFLAEANWIAATADATKKSPTTLLMAYQPDALLVLQRVVNDSSATGADPKRADYCAKAQSASQKTICNERELWRMHTYSELARARAQSPRAEVNAAIDANVADLMQKREDCKGARDCLYGVLDRHIEVLVQRW